MKIFERRSQSLQKCIIIPALMCFMMLTRFVNVRVHVNTGTKGNLVTAERGERLPKLIEGSKNVYMFEMIFKQTDVFRDRNYSGRRRRVIKWAPFVFSRFFGSTSCMIHDYVPTIYKASELEQVATSDLERSYDL